MHNNLPALKDFFLYLDTEFEIEYKTDLFFYYVFSRIVEEDKAWYFRGFSNFLFNFQSTNYELSWYNPEDVRESLYELLNLFTGHYSELEIIFFLECTNEWIDWNLKSEFQFISEEAIEKFDLDILTEHFQMFHFLIKSYLNFDIDVPMLFDKLTGKLEMNSNNNPKVSNPKNYVQIQKIIAFLKGNHIYNKRPYLQKGDFELLSEYLKQLVYKGKIKVTRKIKTINATQATILRTFYLINNTLYGRAKNPNIFHFLVEGIENFADYYDAVKGDLRNSGLNKNFKKKPYDYKNHNPYELE